MTSECRVYVLAVDAELPWSLLLFFFFQAEDGIRDVAVTGVQTCALPISTPARVRAGWSGGGSREFRDHGDVLVAPAAQVQQDDVARAPRPAVRQHPGDGVGALQSRQDPFESGQQGERLECLPVGHCFIQYPTAVLQVSVFGPDPRIVEARGHAVGWLDLPVGVLEEVTQAAVE